MENEKLDTHTVRKNLPKLAGLIASVALLIALAYIYHLNGYSKTPQVKATSTSRVSETASPMPTPTIVSTNTPTPAEIEKTKQDQVLKIINSQESRWVEMGYLPDLTKNGGALIEKTIEINGTQVDAVGFRIGMTEIWTDKKQMERTLDYYNGQQKQVGEVIVPNKKVEDWQYKVGVLGAYIHAHNMGFGEGVLDYLNSLQVNSNTDTTKDMYTIQGYEKGSGNTYHIANLPSINGALPVRIFMGNPTLTQAEAEKKNIFGGSPNAPFKLPYYIPYGWAGLFADNNSGMTIAFDGVLSTENGYGNDYYTDSTLKIYFVAMVGISESMRSPKTSGAGFSPTEFRYIQDTIIGVDRYSPLLIWGKK